MLSKAIFSVRRNELRKRLRKETVRANSGEACLEHIHVMVLVFEQLQRMCGFARVRKFVLQELKCPFYRILRPMLEEELQGLADGEGFQGLERRASDDLSSQQVTPGVAKEVARETQILAQQVQAQLFACKKTALLELQDSINELRTSIVKFNRSPCSRLTEARDSIARQVQGQEEKLGNFALIN
jgi:hypothetical protein